jgi:hypothetical protein
MIYIEINETLRYYFSVKMFPVLNRKCIEQTDEKISGYERLNKKLFENDTCHF